MIKTQIEQALSRHQAWGITALRIAVGVVFVYHGSEKIFVKGIGEVAGSFEQMGLPVPMVNAVLACAAEFLCGLALLAGFQTRLASIPLAFVMVVAFLTVHMKGGFSLANGGFEYVFVLFLACVALLFLGSGAASVDQVLQRRST
jgi:putative oxidoreductase